MRTFKPYTIGINLFLLFLSATGLNYHSIKMYWQQQYPNSSELFSEQNFYFWKIDKQTTQIIPEEVSLTLNEITHQEINPEPLVIHQEESNIFDVSLEEDLEKDLAEIWDDQSNKPEKALANEKITLQKGDMVLFIGDSMLQSFAPHMQKWLKNQHHINSLNLGRHSTGLTNQSYYDWPVEAEKRFAETPNLKLVVLLMGANDAGNISVSKRKNAIFKTPEWAEVYGQRILKIVDSAEQHGAKVIWLGLPYMRLEKYDQKIRYINQVLAQTLSHSNALYFPIHHLLDGGKNSYQDVLIHKGKLVRIRHKDGIHLDSFGELLILEALKEKIEILPTN